ncbi:MAG: YbhB/YbcL family Raf kinase inhibitor-like protein [archaeon]
MGKLQVVSSAFLNGNFIPPKYGRLGGNVNPPLEIRNVPNGTKSLVLIVDDPDAPTGVFTHWVVWNIFPKGIISENNVPGIEGQNDFGQSKYDGPSPPSGTHHYFFRAFALREMLALPKGSSRKELEEVMLGKVICEGELVGKYSKQ